MLHFVSRLPGAAEFDAVASPSRLVRSWPWAATGGLFLPYLLFPFAGPFPDTLSLANSWDGLWPILVGCVLAFRLAQVADRIPRVPTGDTLIIGEAAFDRSLALGALFDRLDDIFRRWCMAIRPRGYL
jgi:hypothetical protein